MVLLGKTYVKKLQRIIGAYEVLKNASVCFPSLMAEAIVYQLGGGVLFIISSDLLGRVDLGAGGLFAECLCPAVDAILVKPYCSRREERCLGPGRRWGFWDQKRLLWCDMAQRLGRGGLWSV